MTLAADTIDVELAGQPVLKGVSAIIASGRITGVLGPNGAGKSTLLKAMAGIVPLQSGLVTLDEASLAGLGPREVARRIAYLPQERSVHWPLAARAIVALGRLPHRSPGAAESEGDAGAIAAAMQAMDVDRFGERPVDKLSGGERARVLLARALAQEASVILADEPIAGLDPAHALDVFAVLGRLAAEGRAVAVALHDLSLAARFCHDVVILEHGRVAAAGQMHEAMTGESLSQVFGLRMVVGQFNTIPIVLPVAALR